MALFAGRSWQMATFTARAPAGSPGAFLAILQLPPQIKDFAMNTITILSLVALATTGLALIHETRLRRAAHSVLCRLVQSLGHKAKGQDLSRDTE